MPPHDPQVQDAANHAVKSLQQRSNSLFPYELQEIVHAKAEVSALQLVFFFFFTSICNLNNWLYLAVGGIHHCVDLHSCSSLGSRNSYKFNELV